MLRRRLGVVLTLIAGSWTVCGCESAGTPHGYQNDPLVLSKKPIPGKVDGATPVVLASAEPEAPPIPQTFLASGTQQQDTVSAMIPLPDQPVPQSDEQKVDGPAAPLVSREISPKSLPARLVARTKDGGLYGHAADYTWIQGKLEQHPSGCLFLRYGEPFQPDAWDGKICLPDDPRLKAYKEGDLIRIEGELIAHAVAGASAMSHASYRIRTIVPISSAP